MVGTDELQIHCYVYLLQILCSVPTLAPLSPFSVARNSRTLNFTWSPPPEEHQNGIIIEYKVQVTEVLTGEMVVKTSNSTTIEVSGLHPDYAYEWRVAAVTVGVGPYTNTTTTRLPEDGNKCLEMSYRCLMCIFLY